MILSYTESYEISYPEMELIDEEAILEAEYTNDELVEDYDSLNLDYDPNRYDDDDYVDEDAKEYPERYYTIIYTRPNYKYKDDED